jgi:hypothetical protein
VLKRLQRAIELLDDDVEAAERLGLELRELLMEVGPRVDSTGLRRAILGRRAHPKRPVT